MCVYSACAVRPTAEGATHLPILPADDFELGPLQIRSRRSGEVEHLHTPPPRPRHPSMKPRLISRGGCAGHTACLHALTPAHHHSTTPPPPPHPHRRIAAFMQLPNTECILASPPLSPPPASG